MDRDFPVKELRSMSTTQARLVSFAGRMLAVVALTTAGSALLHAQTAQSVNNAAAAQSAAAQAPKLDLKVPAADLTSDSGSSSSSSSDASGNEVALNTTAPIHFMDAMQYGGGGRRRYGRPRYRGGNTNADGSPKYDFYVGGGYAQPVGDTYHYFTPSWGFQAGGGRMFNARAGVNLEFSYDHLGLNGRTLDQQSYIYFADTNPSDNGLDANAHDWAFSLQPIYNIRSGAGLGAYVTGGVGFYHKVTNFTIPEEEEYCDPFYGICEPIEVNGTFDHYTSNAPGFDGGFGLTYKFSRFSNERLYGEIRYVVTLNSQRQGLTYADVANNPNYTYTGSNFFPANSNRTTYLPVKFGIRF